jgi:transposase-like protein
METNPTRPRPRRLISKTPTPDSSVIEHMTALHSLTVEPLVFKCQNPQCHSDTDLSQLGVRTVKMSMWQCPKCQFVYFYSHTEETLSEGLKPKPRL